MNTLLLALGLLTTSEGVTDVTTPSERVFTVTRAGSFFTATQGMDPADTVDYQINLEGLLDDGEAVDSVAVAVTSASSLLGFKILSEAPYAPEEVDNANLRIWLEVETADQNASQFAGAGSVCAFEITTTTDSTPARTYQRTGRVTVAQR